MILPEDFIERIRQANDIVTVMSGYARLIKAGRDFVCLCPFHSEKTPSCHVYTDSQSFYCFGCGTGGDVINFTRLTNNLDYLEAVRLLAENSGIPMPEDGDESGNQLRKRKRVYDMNTEAAKFFVNRLLSEDGRQGLEYCRKRGLTDNTIRKYGLGYAPDSWNALKSHMNALGYYDAELVEASLLKQNENGNIYDMFRGRIMFPIIDRTGKVIAFSGRRTDGEKAGKYINSADTPVFSKGENIFSLNFAKNSKRKYMILCEGNLDAVMLNQAGFDNAVAGLGTAFTPAQARLLRFYCDEVMIAYDSDQSGEKATVKVINLLAKEGISARVLDLGDAKDPDEYIKTYGAKSFEGLLEKSVSTIQFELDKLKKAVNLDEPQGRAEYLKKAVAFLAGIDNKLDRMVYISEVARDCGVETANVQSSVEAAVKSKAYYREKNEKRELLRNTYNTPRTDGGEQSILKSRWLTPREKAERGIIAFLLHSPDKLSVVLRNLSPADFSGEFNRRLFETLILWLNKRQTIDISLIGGEFSAEEVGRIKSIIIENSALPFTDERLNDYINSLVTQRQDQNKKAYGEMTNDEALEYIKLLKEKKTRLPREGELI